MDLSEATIRSVNWGRFRISTGTAAQFGDQLIRLLRSRDAGESKEAWKNIEESVFSQDTIFSAAEPTIDAMLAALVEERPMHVRALIIDLLFLLLNGGSDDDPNLHERCRKRALRGTWLLVREVVTGPASIREVVLDVLELIDQTEAIALRSRLGS